VIRYRRVCHAAVEHRDVHELAAPRAFARQQGGEDADRSHERTAADVGHLHRQDRRRAAGSTRDAEHAGVAEVVDVVPDLVAVRAVLPVAGDRAVDEARVEPRHALVIDAETGGHARPEAFEDDVRLRRQTLEDRAPLGVLEIESHAALVALDERNAESHDVVRGGDDQHVDAEVGQHQRAERPGQLPRQIEQLHVVQGGGHRISFGRDVTRRSRQGQDGSDILRA